MAIAKAEITISRIVDIASVTRYYKLQSSTASAPAKPTTNPPSGWATAEPSYTSGSTNTLYFVDQTIFTNGTFSYSTVSISSSYEAAKEAYNKAQAAGDAASDANDKIDNLEVGGRNYLLHTKDLNTSDKGHFYKPEAIHSYIGNYAGFSDTGEGLKYTYKGKTINDGVCFPLAYDDCIKTGDDIIISFDYRGTITHPGVWLVLQRSGDNVGFIPKFSLTPNTTEWTRYEYTFPKMDINPRVAFELLLFTDSSEYYNSTDWFEIRKGSLKIEKGNKATDWTPAPEDVQQGINDAQDTANNAQNSATNNLESINQVKSELQILNNSISSLVTDSNGGSLMTQTPDGWTFNIGNIQSALDKTVQDLNTMEGDLASVNGVVDNLHSLTDDLVAKTAYIVIATDDEGNPCIELGKENNPFKVRITNTSIDFMEGSQKIAYITNHSLYIQSSVVTDELQIGESPGWVWKKRENNNLGLRWKL